MSRAAAILILAAVATAASAVSCGSGGADSGAPAGTPTIERTEAVVEMGTEVDPVPEAVGDCRIKPGTQCPGADLRGADLGLIKVGQHPDRRPARLEGSNLRGADFTDAFLEEVDFTGADLRDAILRGAKMRSSFLFQADLRGADLTNADLSFADDDEALFEGATFCNTTMPDASINNGGCP